MKSFLNKIKKSKKILFVLSFLVLTMLFSGLLSLNPASAIGTEDLGMEYGAETELSETDPRLVIARIIQITLGFLAILAVLLIVYAGFLWMTAKGDETQIQKAKDTLKNAVIGLIIILSAFGVATFVLNAMVSATGGGNDPNHPWHPTPFVPNPNVEWTACDSDGDFSGGFCDLPGACISGTYCDFASGCYCLDKKGAGEVCGSIDTDKSEGDSGYCSDANDEQCISEDCNVDTCLCDPAPIITGITPYGGFCVDDVNVPCNSDSDCSSGECDDKTPNGAIGNFISVRGEYFGDGSGPSKVEFVDGNGRNNAGDVVDVNSNCDNGWTENEIIVVLTSGSGTDGATTSISVTVSDGKVDTSNDNKGPVIPDFVINDIIRPGICDLDPNEAKAGEDIDASGNNFEPNSEFYFGSYSKKIEAESFVSNSNISSVASVPLISRGTTTSFIVNDVGGIDVISNYIDFTKKSEGDSAPYISYFTPLAGSIGQYVTIYGGGFGDIKGTNNSVKFVNGGIEIEADYVFPQVCSDNIWKKNQILVKVPEGVDDNGDGVYDEDFKINVQIGFLDPVQSMDSFNANSSVELLPGLCKMVPTLGPNNTPINIWGEYFGDDHGSVRFYFEKTHNDNSDKITFWDIDSDYEDGVQKIMTEVHSEASSGAVRARQKNKTSDSDFGNGLHFKVGMCNQDTSPNEACVGNGGICCMSGYREGSCVSNIVDCYSVADSSVYEWEFTTKYSGDAYGSCQEYSITEEECLIDKFCPNSPGNCSLDSGGSTSVGASCNCDDYGDCASNSCDFNSNLDSCVYQDSGVDSVCNISKTVQDINGDDLIAYCGDDGDWYFYEEGSCPSGWSKNIDGDCATSSPACDSCVYGTCIDNNDSDLENGVCVAKHDICNGGNCNNGQCETNTSEICECCCRMDAEQSDCCTFINPYDGLSRTLSCEGACGQYLADDDGFGRCTNCTIKDTNGNIDQDASDAACNCGTVSGKYCDTSMADGRGVCMECGGLNMNLCSIHSGSCCVDVMSDNLCVGGPGDDTLDDSGNNVAYCGYYQCTQLQTESGNTYEGACSDERTKGGIGLNLFDTEDVCNIECASNTGDGAEKSCYDRDSSTCSINCSYPNYCIGESGGVFGQSVQGDDDTCKCCCQPVLDPADDECTMISNKMECTPDMGECTGNERGLCCGCESDYDCSKDPSTVGCGKDTCCHARPDVDSVEPQNNDENVCTNIQIKATFDVEMNESSLEDNFILLGQFDSSCPDGTEYLSSVGQNFAQNQYNIKNKWSNIFDIFSKKVRASGDIYCRVKGGIDSEYDSDNNRTSLIFNASSLLSTSTNYFAIIKGDDGLNSESGVLSDYNIGMKGDNNTSQTVFNGIEYPKAYIWKFTTINGQHNKGACEVDHIEITPNSYLFKTTEDDLNENDSNSNDASYDSVSSEGEDSDKVFKARAKNVDGQTLLPIVGTYDWNWSWEIDDDNVIDFEDGTGDTKDELISAKTTISEGKANLTARATINNALYGVNGDEIAGVSEVWVFVCNNPWPAYIYNSGVYTWSPWRDSGSCVDGACDNMNYELYYCKDSESENDIVKEDDLPTIKNTGSSRGTYSPLVCSDVVGDCIGKISSQECNYDEDAKGYCFEEKCSDYVGDCSGINNGDACVYGGTCSTELRIQKETYFFREDNLIDDIGLTSLVSGSGGQSIDLTWTDAMSTYDYFTIYYGVSSGNYNETVDYVDGLSYTISELDKDIEYFFRIGGNNENGMEKLSDEISLTTKDIDPPSDFNSSLSVSAGDERVYLEWLAPSDDDLTYFKVKWIADDGSNCSGVTSYGESSELLSRDDESFIIRKLTNNVNYCVAVVAGDDSGNETVAGPELVTPNFGTEITACPLGSSPSQEEGGKLGDGVCMLTQDLADTIVSNMDLENANCGLVSGHLLGGEKYKCRIELDKYQLPSGWSNDITVAETSCVNEDGAYNVKLRDGEDLLSDGDDTASINNEYLEFYFNPLINSNQNCTSTIVYSLSDTKRAYTKSDEFILTITQNPKISNIDGFTSNNKRVGDIVLVNADITVDTDYFLDTNNINIKNAEGSIVGVMNEVVPGEYSTTFKIESITDYFIHAYAYNRLTKKITESFSKIELGDVQNSIVVTDSNVGNVNVNSNIVLAPPVFSGSTNQIKLSWTDSGSDTIEYNVDYKLGLGGTMQSISSGLNLEHTINNVVSNETYYISIRGVDSGNTETLSNQVSIRINNSISSVVVPEHSYENILFSTNASGALSTLTSEPENEDDKIEVLIILDNFTNVYSSEAILSTDWENRLSEIIGSTGNGILSRPPFSSNSSKFKWYLASVDSGKDCYSSYCTDGYANSIDVLGQDINGNYFNIGTNWADQVIVLSDDPYYGYAYRTNGWAFTSGASESYNIISVPNFGNVYYSLMAFKFADDDYSLIMAMSKEYCNDHISDFTGAPDCNRLGKFQPIVNFDPDSSNTSGNEDIGLSYAFNFSGDVTTIDDFKEGGDIVYDYVFIYENGSSYEAHYPIDNIVPSLVVSHEFGHSFGLLLDEYITGTYIANPSPNCSNSDSGDFTFDGCLKSSWYRNSDNSIMKELNTAGAGNSFNTVSRDWISNIFDCFDGSCSAKCDICDISSAYFNKNSAVDCSTCP